MTPLGWLGRKTSLQTKELRDNIAIGIGAVKPAHITTVSNVKVKERKVLEEVRDNITIDIGTVKSAHIISVSTVEV